jgi:hypothetical protein
MVLCVVGLVMRVIFGFVLGSDAAQHCDRTNVVRFGARAGRCRAANGRVAHPARSGEYAQFGQQDGEDGFSQFFLQTQCQRVSR